MKTLFAYHIEETYVNNTYHNRHLHLVRVSEHEGVVGSMPRRVQSKGVCVAIRDCNYRGSIAIREGPPGVPDMECFRENVVIHEPSVNRKDAHQKNNVATTDNR
jgi:hypothetical protein